MPASWFGLGARRSAACHALWMSGPRVPETRAVVLLPTADEVRADVQRMVDLGHRLTGSPGHAAFCTWLEHELRDAGLEIGPYDVYDYDYYRAGEFDLEILEGVHAGPIDVATSYVRSTGTPPDGVTGPLVLADGFPATDI